MAECFGPQSPPLAVLSGPSFSLEVAEGHPTALVLASADADVSRRLQHLLSGPRLRIYTSRDVVGVELAGALKNVIAVAAGISDALCFGHNSRASLLTRGLAEIGRLGLALGARRRTFAGLAGMGDLVLTCTGHLSRNRRVGLELGAGRRLADVVTEMRTVAEGIPTTVSAYHLARREGVEMPIIEQVYASPVPEQRPSAGPLRPDGPAAQGRVRTDSLPVARRSPPGYNTRVRLPMKKPTAGLLLLVLVPLLPPPAALPRSAWKPSAKRIPSTSMKKPSSA